MRDKALGWAPLRGARGVYLSCSKHDAEGLILAHVWVMDLRSCIPKDKFDIDAIEKAADVGFPTLFPVLPDLLMWVQDGNWPVAGPTGQLLATAGPEIIPYL